MNKNECDYATNQVNWFICLYLTTKEVAANDGPLNSVPIQWSAIRIGNVALKMTVGSGRVGSDRVGSAGAGAPHNLLNETAHAARSAAHGHHNRTGANVNKGKMAPM